MNKATSLALLAYALALTPMQASESPRAAHSPDAPRETRAAISCTVDDALGDSSIAEESLGVAPPPDKLLLRQAYKLSSLFGVLNLNGKKSTIYSVYELNRPLAPGQPNAKRMLDGQTEIDMSIGIYYNMQIRTYLRDPEGLCLPLEVFTVFRNEAGHGAVHDSLSRALINREGFKESPGDSITFLFWERYFYPKNGQAYAQNTGKRDKLPELVSIAPRTRDLLGTLEYLRQHPHEGGRRFAVHFYGASSPFEIYLEPKEEDGVRFMHMETAFTKQMIDGITHAIIDFVPGQLPFHMSAKTKYLISVTADTLEAGEAAGKSIK